ncbi:hypothetical protein [Mucilaginibacter gotjawali]|uniref:Type VI protein secretion system component VasK n=2 Tax=Mucilaginibacter gotjawali TaxID=1550579 RepID=A0A839SLQ5_9SPHI|nr:hypothetical protein [Mucilaginibacter gotjawali]MBB3058253.1 type VI protein secretion system component VasK [Mucilaginibacter gotjawali]BAU55628.1 hypothetical protein MgSA37_03819 [Mucilaginibacter gotjawali]
MNWKLFNDKNATERQAILEKIMAFDEKEQKATVHARLDKKTAMLLKQLKLATGVDIQQVIAYAVSELIRQHPELKIIIKNFLKKLNE